MDKNHFGKTVGMLWQTAADHVRASRDLKFGRWEPTVRMAVGKKKDLPFLRVASKHIQGLSPEEHMFDWSFVDWVMHAHPGSWGRSPGP